MASRAKRPAEDATVKTYRVTGPHAVHGTPSGGTFTADLGAAHEDWLLSVGHVQIIEPAGGDVDSANSAETE